MTGARRDADGDGDADGGATSGASEGEGEGETTTGSGSGTASTPGPESEPEAGSEPLLSIDDLHAGYDESRVLRGVTMSVNRGEVVSLVGRNGVGKTTTLRSVVGIVRPDRGTISLDGDDVTDLPDHARVKRGISYVPEDRQVFPDLTTAENLRMGTVGSGADAGVFTVDEVYDLFPRLAERRSNKGIQLSGGEQQMLAIARALVGRTKILLLDEPSEGLAPQIVDDVLDAIERIRDEGVTVLLVEQNIRAAKRVADRHHVLHKGTIVFEGTTADLDDAPDVQDQYLGVSVGSRD
jgi:branched-chain amino acid transport system ATP-binding protein